VKFFPARKFHSELALVLPVLLQSKRTGRANNKTEQNFLAGKNFTAVRGALGTPLDISSSVASAELLKSWLLVTFNYEPAFLIWFEIMQLKVCSFED
jgi:hypothetical protein